MPAPTTRPHRRGAVHARDGIDRCHEPAEESGARIVHACGFDSIPSDLGVLLLHERARADSAGELGDTTLVVTACAGASAAARSPRERAQIEAMRGDPALSRLLADPYALSPDRAAEPDFGTERDTTW